MQTLRALVIMALAPLVAGFGAFSEDAIKAQHILVCSNAQQHVEDAHSMLHGRATPPHVTEAPGLRAATGSD